MSEDVYILNTNYRILTTNSKWHEFGLYLKDIVIFTWSMDFILTNGFVNSFTNSVGMIFVSQMVQHVNGCVQDGNGVGDVLSSNGCSSITSGRFEDGILKVTDWL